MRDNQDSDDELLSADRRWWRRWYVISVAFAVVVVALSIWWISFALAHHPFQQLGLPPETGEQLIVAVPLVVTICLALALRYFVGPPPASRNETVVRRTADRHYARLRRYYPIAVAAIAVPLFSTQVRTLTFYTLIVAMAVQTLVILRGFGWSRSFRRGLDDELTRALRAKALRFGHGLAAAILIVACIYARYRPVSADSLLLQILFITSVTPVLYFLFLEWQSGRNG
jgi:hypothetical protein